MADRQARLKEYLTRQAALCETVNDASSSTPLPPPNTEVGPSRKRSRSPEIPVAPSDGGVMEENIPTYEELKQMLVQSENEVKQLRIKKYSKKVQIEAQQTTIKQLTRNNQNLEDQLSHFQREMKDFVTIHMNAVKDSYNRGKAKAIEDFKSSEEYSATLRYMRVRAVREFLNSKQFDKLMLTYAAGDHTDGFLKAIDCLKADDELNEDFDVDHFARTNLRCGLSRPSRVHTRPQCTYMMNLPEFDDLVGSWLAPGAESVPNENRTPSM